MAKSAKTVLLLFILMAATNVWSAAVSSSDLFGYQEIKKKDLNLFPQWLSVLERHLLEMDDSVSCVSLAFNHCHLKRWQAYLKSIQHLSVMQQIKMVNRYANEKEYTLDIENYGIADYWATPKEILSYNGDCEDYAIIKMLSMKWLGYDTGSMRVVVVQDTNLRVAHAVLALEKDEDILILDNQIEEVISHADIFHYVPVYSVNENNWWMHVPY